jgi:hypothetical protein
MVDMPAGRLDWEEGRGAKDQVGGEGRVRFAHLVSSKKASSPPANSALVTPGEKVNSAPYL